MARASGLIAVVAAYTWLAGVEGAEPAFVVPDAHGQFEFCGAAAMDVNRDGRLDIVCGGCCWGGSFWR